jgi:transposase
LLPPRPAHPLGCHNPRVSDRDAMTAILFVLRTGCQWNALDATGICSCSSAYRLFREWTEAGVFLEFWQQGLIEYDGIKGVDWGWLAADGAMTKAPLGRIKVTRGTVVPPAPWNIGTLGALFRDSKVRVIPMQLGIEHLVLQVLRG